MQIFVVQFTLGNNKRGTHMKESNKQSDKKLVVTLVLLGMAAIATIIFNESRSDKQNRPEVEGDIISKNTNKVVPSKSQSNIANWFAVQQKVK